eukprot:2737523-Prymnesium_polylepis.2
MRKFWNLVPTVFVASSVLGGFLRERDRDIPCVSHKDRGPAASARGVGAKDIRTERGRPRGWDRAARACP